MTNSKLIQELEQIIIQSEKCKLPSDFKSAVDAKVDEIVNTQDTDLLAQAMLLILHVCYGENDG